MIANGEAKRRSRTAQRLIDALYPLFSIVLAVAAWQLATEVGDMPPYVLPSPVDTVRELSGQFPLLLENALSTLLATLLGFGVSVIVGTSLGLLLVSSRVLEKALYPLVVGSQAIPKPALAPLFVVWFGFGLMPRVLVTCLIAFFPIVIGTVAGLRSVDTEQIHLSRSMGLSRWSAFVNIKLPSAMPHILSGLKVGITLAVVGAVVAEFVGSDEGLGNVLLRAIGVTNTPLLFAALIVLTVVAVVLFAVVSWIERLAIPWHVSQRRGDSG